MTATNISRARTPAYAATSNTHLRAIDVLFRREWLKIIREPSRAVGIIVQPLVFWFVIGAGFVPSFQMQNASEVNYQTYFFPGVLALVLLFSAIFSMITLIDDRESGFMQAVLVAPCTRSSIVLGKTFGAVSVALLQAALFLPLFPFAGIEYGQVLWGYFFLVLFLGALSFGLLGFLLAWASPSSSTFHALMSVILIPMWILSGAMFPLADTWMAPLSFVNPASWIVEGFQYALLFGQMNIDKVHAVSSLVSLIFKLSAFCFVVLLAGVMVCRRNR